MFARSLEDLALIADVLMRFDAQDEFMTPLAPPCISSVMAQPVPAEPVFAFIRTSAWEQVVQDTKDGFRELIEAANESKQKTIDIVDLPAEFDDIYQHHHNIMEADLAKSFATEYKQGKTDLSAVLREMIERGQKVTDAEYNTSMEKITTCGYALDEIFESYDAILTPATLAAAPAGVDATGDPVMNTIWTFCGTPAINLPLLQNPAGMPLGVQLVGEKGDDARLFRSSRWLLNLLAD
jgi:Asp-tRNA(Asn)/Glu-tRNA(Gln) amidotransferase A subunit family amidase